MPAFRFAPSPNGRLHLGHAYSALLNAKMARRSRAGAFCVRIEDIDTARCTARICERPQLPILHGWALNLQNPPRIQSQHMAAYGSRFASLQDMGLLYACTCSRKP